MPMTVGDIAAFLEEWAPLSYAEGYDNVGLLAGRNDQMAERVMVAVDASEAVVQEACEKKVNLLITHHPLIFHPIKRIVASDRTGKRLLQLIENQIALYSAHTNMDTAPGGNNDRAAALFGLTNVRAVGEAGEQACLRVGDLSEPILLKDLAARVSAAVNHPSTRLYGDAKKVVRKAALCTGSGMDFAPLAIREGADVLITGDITYHKADEALAAGLTMIDAGHFASDRLSVRWIADALRQKAREMGAKLTVWEANEQDLMTRI